VSPNAKGPGQAGACNGTNKRLRSEEAEAPELIQLRKSNQVGATADFDPFTRCLKARQCGHYLMKFLGVLFPPAVQCLADTASRGVGCGRIAGLLDISASMGLVLGHGCCHTVSQHTVSRRRQNGELIITKCSYSTPPVMLLCCCWLCVCCRSCVGSWRPAVKTWSAWSSKCTMWRQHTARCCWSETSG